MARDIHIPLYQGAAGQSRSRPFPVAPALRQPAVSLLLLGGAVIIGLLVSSTRDAGLFMWAASLFVLGMPHGAYDLSVIGRTSPDARAAVRRFIFYSAITLGCAAAALLAPVIAVLAFLLLAMHHFGVNDALELRAAAPTRWREHVTGFAFGAIPIAAPFVFQPDAAWAPFASIAAAMGADSALDPAILQATALVIVVLASVPVTHSIASLVRSSLALDALLQAGIIAATIALAVLTDPLFAVAAYFLSVHALSHCVRAKTPGRPADRPGLDNLVRVHRESLLLLVPSVLAVFALVLIFPIGMPLHERLALAFLAFCVAGTLPHHLLWLRAI